MNCVVSADSVSSPQIEMAPIIQILTGHTITERSSIPCDDCGTPLHVGDIILVKAFRRTDRTRWLVSQGYCHGCAPESINPPRLGVSEAIIGGRVGTRSDPTGRLDQLCLTELSIRDYSPPDEM
jgi:hypothetical protein